MGHLGGWVWGGGCAEVGLRIGDGLCACYCGYDTLAYVWRCSSAQLACGDYGLYTLSKVYAGGGLVVSGNAGAVEGSITICSGCMCYYSSGMWHPICKTI